MKNRTNSWLYDLSRRENGNALDLDGNEIATPVTDPVNLKLPAFTTTAL